MRLVFVSQLIESLMNCHRSMVGIPCCRGIAPNQLQSRIDDHGFQNGIKFIGFRFRLSRLIQVPLRTLASRTFDPLVHPGSGSMQQLLDLSRGDTLLSQGHTAFAEFDLIRCGFSFFCSSYLPILMFKEYTICKRCYETTV